MLKPITPTIISGRDLGREEKTIIAALANNREPSRLRYNTSGTRAPARVLGRSGVFTANSLRWKKSASGDGQRVEVVDGHRFWVQRILNLAPADSKRCQADRSVCISDGEGAK